MDLAVDPDDLSKDLTAIQGNGVNGKVVALGLQPDLPVALGQPLDRGVPVQFIHLGDDDVTRMGFDILADDHIIVGQNARPGHAAARHPERKVSFALGIQVVGRERAEELRLRTVATNED